MNKIVKLALWIVASIILILTLISFIFFFKMKYEISQMHSLPTQEVVENIYAINDSFANLYLVKDSNNYIAIDAGNDIEIVKTELKKLAIDPEHISALFLTHSDADHVAALSLFKNAKIYLPKEELQMINGTTPRLLFVHNSIAYNDFLYMEDQDSVMIGNTTIKGISTPGHTPGSMCFVVNNRALFVGDAFNQADGKVINANDYFSMDIKRANDSFYKIKNLPNIEFIFTAHTGYCPDYKSAVNTTLK